MITVRTAPENMKLQASVTINTSSVSTAIRKVTTTETHNAQHGNSSTPILNIELGNTKAKVRQ